ncbi:uncharacterized protein RCC_08837 [Ramularia collo-cygni]|uniref:Uncharacterized protein n=1 Tax=Ramularia collo-cygni TaxID=112498 RepID=A0A2D3UYH4_9PEZI|nr:uncharacterized protein RCC_08837 [Ramularia collo-cygni]CZT23127.1 uncharacterized protein RCC_08837 [Ramularia collo-cygni]
MGKIIASSEVDERNTYIRNLELALSETQSRLAKYEKIPAAPARRTNKAGYIPSFMKSTAASSQRVSVQDTTSGSISRSKTSRPASTSSSASLPPLYATSTASKTDNRTAPRSKRVSGMEHFLRFTIAEFKKTCDAVPSSRRPIPDEETRLCRETMAAAGR